MTDFTRRTVCPSNSHVSTLYGPLRSDKREIRRVMLFPAKQRTAAIECSMETYSLDAVQKDGSAIYTALSYPWGNGKQIEYIFLKNYDATNEWHHFPVTKNLYRFLRQARRKRQSIWLWADQICINQSDEQEKALQIRMMGTIFRCAYSVCCWLGDADRDTHLAVRMLESIEAGPENYHLIQDAHLSALLNLLYKPWWNRLWVAQEVILAQSATLVCGRYEMSLWQFALASQVFNFGQTATPSERVRRLAINEANFDPWLVENVSGRLHRCISTFMKPNFEDRDGLPKTLDRLRALKCSDARDKVYGALGMFPEMAQIVEVDYTASFRQVYTSIAFATMKQVLSLDLLVLAAIPRVQLWSEEIPSWVPDWRAPEEGPTSKGWRMAVAKNMFCLGGLYLHESRLFNACGSFAFDAALESGEILRTRAIRLDHITILGAYGCSFNNCPPPGSWSHDLSAWMASLHFDVFPLCPQDADRDKAFLSSISRDTIELNGDLVRMCDEDYIRFSVVSSTVTEGSNTPFIQKVQEPPLSLSNRFYTSMVNVRLCRLSNGYLAQVPDHAEPGDVVFVLGGTRLPYLLRPINNNDGSVLNLDTEQKNFFRLVGPCFVYGVMNGEAAFDVSVTENIYLV